VADWVYRNSDAVLASKPGVVHNISKRSIANFIYFIDPENVFIYTYVPCYVYIYIYVSMYKHTYIHTYIRSYICVYTHKYIHTYIYIHMYICAELQI
jgi:hypothetical protein